LLHHIPENDGFGGVHPVEPSQRWCYVLLLMARKFPKVVDARAGVFGFLRSVRFEAMPFAVVDDGVTGRRLRHAIV
jgi:hypothetical protein